VLTRVSSRGQALGGEAAELGRMAAEQESALRHLITGSPPGPRGSLTAEASAAGEPDAVPGTLAGQASVVERADAPGDLETTAGGGGLAPVTAGAATVTAGRGAGRGHTRLSRPSRPARAGAASSGGPGLPGDNADSLVDLRPLIERFGDPQVTVSCPAGVVPLPSSAAAALGGATAAALDNVRQHGGAQAHAWVLVEDVGEMVRVSIRDDGIGFGDGRLAEAKTAGRLGVSHSIVGRLREVGGTAWVTSAPGQGTEVELAVPRIGPPGPRPHRGRSPDLA
jgi:hypothetical protein